MSWTRRGALAAGAAALSACATFRPSTPRLARLVEGPDAVLGLAVIARDARGRIVLHEAHGRAVRGSGAARTERPFTADAPVRVASISKMIAALAVAALNRDGRLDPDADVSTALGWRLRHPAAPDTPITQRMLAAHVSGLRNGETYPVPLGRALREAFEPGGRHYDGGAWFAPAAEGPGFFSYQDVNFALLAQLAERITGERFDRFVRRVVLAPLGLDAGYNWSGVGQAARDRAAAACRPEDGVWTPQVDAEVPPAPVVRVLVAEETPGADADDYRIGENGFVFSPQGGLRASTRDLDALAQAFAGRGPAPFPRDLVEAVSRPVWTAREGRGDPFGGLYQAYGFGVQTLVGTSDRLFAGEGRWRGHFGDAYGLASGLLWAEDGRTLAYVICGVPRPLEQARGARSALSVWEEAIADAAEAAWA